MELLCCCIKWQQIAHRGEVCYGSYNCLVSAAAAADAIFTITMQAIQRGDTECPICLMRLDGSSSTIAESLPATDSGHPRTCRGESAPPRYRGSNAALYLSLIQCHNLLI